MKGFFTVGSFSRNWQNISVNTVLVTVLVCSFAVLSAQNATSSKVALASANIGHISVKDSRFAKGGIYHDFKPEDELVEKRDAFSKHFHNKQGTITAVISQSQVHYQKPGSKVWEDIETTIKPNSTGKLTNFSYAVPENMYQVYFDQSLDNGYVIHFATGDLQLGMNGEMRILDGSNNVIKKSARSKASGKVSDNTITYSNTFPAAYDEVKVSSVSIAHDIVLTAKPAGLSNSNAASVAFREFVKLPAGWKIVSKAEYSDPNSGNTLNSPKALYVIDNTGKAVTELLEPVIEEQNERHIPHDGAKGHTTEITHASVKGEFSVEYADGGAYIETRVPAAWLNAPDRQYPVVVDPTANCYTPNTCSYDGYSTSSSACYGGSTYCGDDVLWQGANTYAGWMYFSIGNILSNEIISDVQLNMDIYAVDDPFFYVTNANTYTSTCSTLWSDETGGTQLANVTSLNATGWFSVDLGSAGATALQAQLGNGSWGVGLYDYDGSNTWYGYAYGWFYGSGVSPYIYVTYSNPNSGACDGYTNGSGVYQATITPTCSSQTVNMPSTSYVQWTATAGVTYNFSLSASGWGSDNMAVYYNNGSSWVPALSAVLSLSIAPTSTELANSSTLRISAYNGTGCPPTWYNGSAVLTYQIAAPSTPAISDGSLTQQCVGAGVTYTASGITVGTFNQFIMTNSSTGVTDVTTNPYTWTPTPAGSTESVVAQSINGGCTANSSALSLTVNSLSSAGSFVSTLYSCGSGSTYTTAGVLTAQSVTGINGSILGWGYGSTANNCAANTTAYPTGAGSSTAPWTTIPGNNSELMIEVQNGACSPVQSCYPVVANTTTAPTSASVSPTNVCAGYSGNITLTYSGGGSNHLPATLKWYSGSCGGTLVGTGQSLVIAAPSSTTTYYCAWVDPCGTLTTCQSATFTVTALPTVSAASYSICNGGTTTLSPSSGGTWVSNNTAVANVSGNTVNAVGTGSATFTFTSSTSPNCSATTSAVTVSANPTVSITGPTSFCGGTTTTLSPTSGGTWVSNNTSVATVSGYTVTGTTAGGSTNFTFTSSTSPNCASSTASVTVTGLPTVFGVTGGGTYCYGSSATVGLSGSQTGVNYQLVVNGGTNVGSPVAGTGSAFNFPNVTTVGTYTVVATTVTNSCSDSMSGSAVVNELTPNVTNNPGATSVGTNGATLNGTD